MSKRHLLLETRVDPALLSFRRERQCPESRVPVRVVHSGFFFFPYTRTMSFLSAQHDTATPRTDENKAGEKVDYYFWKKRRNKEHESRKKARRPRASARDSESARKHQHSYWICSLQENLNKRSNRRSFIG